MRARLWALIAVAFAGCRASLPLDAPEIGVVEEPDAHVPQPWRPLTAEEQSKFDLGLATFNTEWVPANAPSGRIDGLGPLFNSQGCDACHNSRRRGRGPRGDGEAPADLVIQLGRRLRGGGIERGIDAYGHVLNTAAVPGFTREASVRIQYDGEIRILPDGTRVALRMPRYAVTDLSGPPLPANTVLMPRMPPPLHGVGLLELVPRSTGRFGWQATEPTIALQTASAMSREMGLTTTLVGHIDCGHADTACTQAPMGGTPEVEPQLFDALVFFQRLQAVPIEPARATSGERLFAAIGCTACHSPTLSIRTPAHEVRTIHPYTDLRVHDLGSGLADRDVSGAPVLSKWRTAPLWGLNASVRSGQPLRLLHDGRARSLDEAILWHDGEGRAARTRFEHLTGAERRELTTWIEGR